MKTKVFIELFKGHNLFAIHQVDDQGNKIEPGTNKSHVMSFGAKKAAVLLSHLEDLEKFVENNKPTPPNDIGVDLSKLTPEQQAQILAIIGEKK